MKIKAEKFLIHWYWLSWKIQKKGSKKVKEKRNKNIDKKSVHDVVIIELTIKFKNLLLDRRIVNPTNMILQLSCDKKSRLSHDFGTNFNMPLFDKGHRLFHSLSILELTKKHSQSPSTESRHRYFFSSLDILACSNNSHVIKFF